MRAVLIVNPTATSTTPAGRDLLAHALKSRLQLTVEHTSHRGHGSEIAQAAAAAGVDLIVVHGGDGTVSGVVNGLLGSPGSPRAEHVPAVAVVPGGSANVLARSLGISQDPVAATNQLIQLLDDYRRQQTWRRIGLIDCGERWALINAGMGVDAEVVAAVEAQRDKGVKVNALRYWRVAIPVTIAFSRREPVLTLELPGRDPVPGVHFVWVSNTSPWTYSNSRPMVTNPDCTFESGLGVFALDEHEGVSHAELGSPDPLEGPQAQCQTTRPRRRRGLATSNLNRRPNRQPVRRRLSRLARNHDVPVGPRPAPGRRPARQEHA